MENKLQEVYNNLLPQQKLEVDYINLMSREQMAHNWRFAPAGDKYFDSSKPYFQFFDARFKELGRFSPKISKKIGWSEQ